MTYFLKQIEILDKISKDPRPENIKGLLDIIKSNESSAIYFYVGTDNKTYPHFDWIPLLFEAREFEDLANEPKKIGSVQRVKSSFIKEAAKQKPKDVYEVISSIKAKEELIQSNFLEALEAMPDFLEKGLRLIWDILGEKKHYVWFWQGECAARIMLTLLKTNPDQAFRIAYLLLEIWDTEKVNSGRLKDAKTRFNEHEYKELIEKYYSHAWAEEPYRAFELLVKILDDYLKGDKKKKSEDQSRYFYIMVEDITEGSSWGFDDMVSIYIDAMYKCMLNLIEKDKESVDKTLLLLRSKNKAIFTRFEILLLSLIDGKCYRSRINQIAQNKKYFDRGCYNKEYVRLVNEQKQMLSKESKKRILGWIGKETITDKKRFDEWFAEKYDRQPTEQDYRQYENQYRAQELYPIREVFPEEYKKHKQLSGADDDKLKPIPSHSGVRMVAGDEGTPITTEEMLEKGAKWTLEKLLDEKTYNYKPKEYQTNTPKEALGYVFQQVVKAKPIEYLNADIELIKKLSDEFLSRYFLGLMEAGSWRIEGFNWDTFLTIAETVTQQISQQKDIGRDLQYMVNCIQSGFNKQNPIKYTIERLYRVLEIAKLLLMYKEKREESEQDPVQTRCNSVTGEAMMTCLSLGIICKRDFKEEYKTTFKSKLEAIFDNVLNEIKTPWTVCTFGSDFPRIFWLTPDWVEKRLKRILSPKNWNLVWGTYLHWGRPSKELFLFLSKNGIYKQAILKKDKIKREKGSEKAAEELAKHFVIAYFNGWLKKSYDEPLFQKFISHADDDLLGYTAQFFTTGFKAVGEDKNKNDDATIKRIRLYWQKRLVVIEKRPKAHLHEVSELACWIHECPIDKKTALELEKRTLETRAARFEGHRDYYNIINALCLCADVNVLKVIRCIGIIIRTTEVSTCFQFYREALRKLLESIQNDKAANQALIKETIGLVDDLAKYHRIYEYRPIFEKLYERFEKL
jgi:hypothetical protein